MRQDRKARKVIAKQSELGTGGSIASQRSPNSVARLAWRLRSSWQMFRQLSQSAYSRLRERRGGRQKLVEAIRIGGAIWTRLRRGRGSRVPVARHLSDSPEDAIPRRAIHHLRAYRLWFERRRSADALNTPPLDRLHAELLQDFGNCSDHPVLEFAAPARVDVSIILPVRDDCAFTYRTLCSLLFAFNDTPFETVLVDDGSRDETTDLGDYVHGIEFVRYAHPQGFAQAVAQGVEKSRGDLLLVLDNRCEVTSRWIDELAAVFRNFERAGVAASNTLGSGGRPPEALGANAVHMSWAERFEVDPTDPRSHYLRKTDGLPGSAFMIPRSLWLEIGEVGGEHAPEYCREVIKTVLARGQTAVVVPGSIVYRLDGDPGGGPRSDAGITRQIPGGNNSRRHRSNLSREPGHEWSCACQQAFRVLFIEQQYPEVDCDAGSYAAFQEIRLFQALGAKVSFLPHNLAWMGHHTKALQRIGVECFYAPAVSRFARFLRDHAREYDIVYVARYKIAAQAIPIVRAFAPQTRVIFNLGDLHFLREQREAAIGSVGYSSARAAETRGKELAVVIASDLTFSYSDVELDILRRELKPGTRLARMPWVVDSQPRTVPFAQTRDILFLGGFAHPPNAAAAAFFARRVMPLLRARLPDVVFNIVGSGAEAAVSELASDNIRIVGHVADLGVWLRQTRVFVAPLLAGAGLKGKVIDALSYGVPSVLSAIAAEGTGLIDGQDCLIAGSPEIWAEQVFRLYSDQQLWSALAANALRAARIRFSFAAATSVLENELSQLGVASRRDWGLTYKYARPDRYDD